MWRDTWIRTLDRESKLLWAYILTNECTHVCGYYELPLGDMELHTGLTDKQLKDGWKALEKEGKAAYIDGWVCIKNYAKHQNVANNERVQKAIVNAMEEVPENVRERAETLFSSGSYQGKDEQKGKDTASDSKEEKSEKKSEDKRRYGEFENVKLTDDEFQKVVDKYGEKNTLKLITNLDTYLEQNGKRYKSHYATLLSWARRDEMKEFTGKSAPQHEVVYSDDGQSVKLVPKKK